MKVKNIVFSGFAAAILMGVAADANADTHVVTKGYIDSLNNTVSAAPGTYVSGVKQVAGKVDSVTTTGFDTTIDEDSDDSNAPTSKAVFDYVTSNDTTYTAGSHINIDANNAIAVDDVTNVGTDIDANDTGLTTGKAVSEYVTSAVEGSEYSGDDTYITVDNDNHDIELTNYTTEAAGITNNSTALTTGKAVYDYVTANDANTTYTAGSHIAIDTANGNAIAVNDVTNVGTDIDANDTGLTTGKAVSEYVTSAVEGSEYSGDGTYITVDNDNHDIELTNVTNVAGGITTGNTALTTANAVFEYVDALTGGVLPQGCDNGNCALVKLGGNLQWVELTTPLQDQDQTTGG